MINHYEQLGLNSNGLNVEGNSYSTDEIKEAFKKRALVLHPDKNLQSETNPFILATNAYKVLSNPQKRLEFDQWLRTQPVFLGPSFTTSASLFVNLPVPSEKDQYPEALSEERPSDRFTKIVAFDNGNQTDLGALITSAGYDPLLLLELAKQDINFARALLLAPTTLFLLPIIGQWQLLLFIIQEKSFAEVKETLLGLIQHVLSHEYSVNDVDRSNYYNSLLEFVNLLSVETKIITILQLIDLLGEVKTKENKLPIYIRDFILQLYINDKSSDIHQKLTQVLTENELMPFVKAVAESRSRTQEHRGTSHYSSTFSDLRKRTKIKELLDRTQQIIHEGNDITLPAYHDLLVDLGVNAFQLQDVPRTSDETYRTLFEIIFQFRVLAILLKRQSSNSIRGYYSPEDIRVLINIFHMFIAYLPFIAEIEKSVLKGEITLIASLPACYKWENIVCSIESSLSALQRLLHQADYSEFQLFCSITTFHEIYPANFNEMLLNYLLTFHQMEDEAPFLLRILKSSSIEAKEPKLFRNKLFLKAFLNHPLYQNVIANGEIPIRSLARGAAIVLFSEEEKFTPEASVLSDKFVECYRATTLLLGEIKSRATHEYISPFEAFFQHYNITGFFPEILDFAGATVDPEVRLVLATDYLTYVRASVISRRTINKLDGRFWLLLRNNLVLDSFCGYGRVKEHCDDLLKLMCEPVIASIIVNEIDEALLGLFGTLPYYSNERSAIDVAKLSLLPVLVNLASWIDSIAKYLNSSIIQKWWGSSFNSKFSLKERVREDIQRLLPNESTYPFSLLNHELDRVLDSDHLQTTHRDYYVDAIIRSRCQQVNFFTRCNEATNELKILTSGKARICFQTLVVIANPPKQIYDIQEKRQTLETLLEQYQTFSEKLVNLNEALETFLSLLDITGISEDLISALAKALIHFPLLRLALATQFEERELITQTQKRELTEGIDPKIEADEAGLAIRFYRVATSYIKSHSETIQGEVLYQLWQTHGDLLLASIEEAQLTDKLYLARQIEFLKSHIGRNGTVNYESQTNPAEHARKQLKQDLLNVIQTSFIADLEDPQIRDKVKSFQARLRADLRHYNIKDNFLHRMVELDANRPFEFLLSLTLTEKEYSDYIEYVDISTAVRMGIGAKRVVAAILRVLENIPDAELTIIENRLGLDYLNNFLKAYLSEWNPNTGRLHYLIFSYIKDLLQSRKIKFNDLLNFHGHDIHHAVLNEIYQWVLREEEQGLSALSIYFNTDDFDSLAQWLMQNADAHNQYFEFIFKLALIDNEFTNYVDFAQLTKSFLAEQGAERFMSRVFMAFKKMPNTTLEMIESRFGTDYLENFLNAYFLHRQGKNENLHRVVINHVIHLLKVRKISFKDLLNFHGQDIHNDILREICFNLTFHNTHVILEKSPFGMYFNCDDFELVARWIIANTKRENQSFERLLRLALTDKEFSSHVDFISLSEIFVDERGTENFTSCVIRVLMKMRGATLDTLQSELGENYLEFFLRCYFSEQQPMKGGLHLLIKDHILVLLKDRKIKFIDLFNYRGKDIHEDILKYLLGVLGRGWGQNTIGLSVYFEENDCELAAKWFIEEAKETSLPQFILDWIDRKEVSHLAAIEDLYGAESRDKIFFSYGPSVPHGEQGLAEVKTLLTRVKNNSLMPIRDLTHFPLNNSRFRNIFPFYAHGLMTRDEAYAAYNDEVQYSVYENLLFQSGTDEISIDEDKMKCRKFFFADPYYQFLQDTMINALDDVINQLDEDTTDEDAHQKAQAIASKKEVIMLDINEHLGQLNSTYLIKREEQRLSHLKLNEKLIGRFREFLKDKDINHSRKFVKDIFRGILGGLLSCPFLGLVLFSSSYRHYFFHTRSHKKLSDVKNNLTRYPKRLTQ